MNDRTLIAAMCLQGLASGSTMMHPEDIVKLAVKYADALLKELSPITGKDIPHQSVREWIRNEALEEAANEAEGYTKDGSLLEIGLEIAQRIRALKKIEVK